ncbi:MAG TPA: PHP domain-containing protein, partial [Myxococcota bacterium]
MAPPAENRKPEGRAARHSRAKSEDRKPEGRAARPSRAKSEDYVELRCRSAFSFLAGASNPEDLIERAAELGYDALALADRDGLYGAPRFHRAAERAGLRGLIGARVTLLGDGSRRRKSDPPPDGGRVQLLVKSRRGYRNLCRLLTKGHRPYEKPH